MACIAQAECTFNALKIISVFLFWGVSVWEIVLEYQVHMEKHMREQIWEKRIDKGRNTAHRLLFPVYFFDPVWI